MFAWHENVKIEVFKGGFIVDSTQKSNIIVDGALNILADSLRSTSMIAPKIGVMGWGGSSAAPSTNNSALSTEFGRKVVTSYTSGGVGQCVSVTYIAPSEAVGQIREFGWFAGTSATAVALSGALVSRVLYDRLKTNLESITVTRTDTLIRTTS